MAAEIEFVGVDDIQVGGIGDSQKNTQANSEFSTENDIGRKENGVIETEQINVKDPHKSVDDSVEAINEKSNAMASATNGEGKFAEAEAAVVDTVRRRFCTTERDGEVEIRCSNIVHLYVATVKAISKCHVVRSSSHGQVLCHDKTLCLDMLEYIHEVENNPITYTRYAYVHFL